MRKRFQEGSLFKRNGCWVAQWWDNGHRRKRRLGRVSEMSKAQAQIQLASILEPINTRTAEASPDCELARFIDGIFFPFYRRKWKTSTAMTTEGRIIFHIRDPYAGRKLGSFSRDELQTFLEGKVEGGLSASVVAHLRWDLKQIFDMAVAEGHLVKNPAHLLFPPRGAPIAPKLRMTLEEVNECFNALALRERVIVKFATLAGMRPGEIFGLKWDAVKGQHCEVRMRVYRGKLDTPKTDHSVRNVALSPNLVADLYDWQARCSNTSANGWVFPSENGKTPLWRDTLWRRNILPRLKQVGLAWVNFQVMRRTHSSLMHDLEVDPKLVADQLGHTLDVNQNVYTKAALRRRQSAVQKLDEALQKSLSEPNGANNVENKK